MSDASDDTMVAPKPEDYVTKKGVPETLLDAVLAQFNDRNEHAECEPQECHIMRNSTNCSIAQILAWKKQ